VALGRFQARARAFQDQLPLHLRQAGHHVEKEAARRCLGVDALRQALEVGALALQFIDALPIRRLASWTFVGSLEKPSDFVRLLDALRVYCWYP
jgi:hypothetical protein